ncbi:hypothetical protein LJR045_002907 [Microbacterium sp. LjRoot45]|uniref:hypothetical protein n=1 Tax=Microbacterium sp. LjRoot45 TaxID=3342329 RepID=UPI003ECEFAC1
MNDTTTDLLAITERTPPLGGMGFRNAAGVTVATWADGDEHDDIVGRRIVHARTLRLGAPTALRTLLVRPGRGYHKCGSEDQWDWVSAFRLRVHDGAGWHTVLDVTDLPVPSGPDAAPVEYDLGGIVTASAVIEIRRSGLDGPWTPWNLADDAFELRGDPPPAPLQGETRLRVGTIDLSGIPEGVSAVADRGTVRFATAFYAVGFSLGRAGFSFLALDDEGTCRVDRDLLLHRPGVDLQGPMLHPVGGPSLISPALRCRVEGTVEVSGNVVSYDIAIPDAGQRLHLVWTMRPDRIELSATREGDDDVEAWESSAWQTAFDPGVAATATLGTLRREGRTGLLDLPLLLHAPGHGSLSITSDSAEATWRSDADRARGWLLGELRLGEEPTERGTTVLRSGIHRALLTWRPVDGGVDAREGTPAGVARALRRTAITGLSYRADTGTFSNNSVSIHCPMSMDTWSALAVRRGTVAGIDTRAMLRDSLERWLDGGPGYASGTMRDGGRLRPAEDEYLISGVGTLLGLAEYLEAVPDAAWLARYRPRIAAVLARLAARDLDGDGLIESPHRRGVSGEHDWSTNWYDVVSFGWKDAYVNALLFRALRLLAKVLPALGAGDLAEGLSPWADRIAESFVPTFLHPDSGWIAGWRSADDRLHDHAFLAVNAIVVNSGVLPAERERPTIAALWREYLRVGAPDPHWGLPNNLWPIPDADLTAPMQGFPHGFYLNGALSHSQSRHFVAALYRVGMTEEADGLLEALCTTLADGSAFGGSQTGVDWRYWDGAPCGYEGQLTEQFGIMAVALERFALLPVGDDPRDASLHPETAASAAERNPDHA